jgi:hypothetical protein
MQPNPGFVGSVPLVLAMTAQSGANKLYRDGVDISSGSAGVGTGVVSVHASTVSIAHNSTEGIFDGPYGWYKDIFVDNSLTGTTSTTIPVNLWGGPDSLSWGANPPTTWGGSDPTLIARFDLARQKCRTIKFRIEDLPISASYGESVSLTGITLEVGTKFGLGKLAATKQVSVK